MPLYYYKVIDYSFRSKPYHVTLDPGYYKFEAWGGSGLISFYCGEGYPSDQPDGRGGYTSGIIKLNKQETFHVYVGQEGMNSGTFNGGPKVIDRYKPGGGATDFRLINADENWSDFESLKSRIMVAAGGGAADCYPGGDAGGIEGHQMNYTNQFIKQYATGGTQTSGGLEGIYHDGRVGQKGHFGMSGLGYCGSSCDGAGSGGSGYYGGGGCAGTGGGGGGSSYISGHEGCIAIKKEAKNENELTPSTDSIHYSQLSFESTVMYSGNEMMPSFTKNSLLMIGNRGNGHARITFLDPIIFKLKNTPQILSKILIFTFLLK